MSANSALSFARLELENRKAELIVAVTKAFEMSTMAMPDIAELCGVSDTTILKIRRTGARGVSLDKLFLIAYSMGLSVNMKVVNVNQ